VAAVPGAPDPVTHRASAAARRLAEEFGPGSGSPVAAVAAARELAVAASSALQAAVDQARGAGHSWRKIGDVLDTTRQAAFQRFGRPVDPRTGSPTNRDTLPGVSDAGRPWFGPKRFGYGYRPQTWPGWLVTGVLVLAVVLVSTLPRGRFPEALVAIPVVLIVMAIRLFQGR